MSKKFLFLKEKTESNYFETVAQSLEKLGYQMIEISELRKGSTKMTVSLRDKVSAADIVIAFLTETAGAGSGFVNEIAAIKKYVDGEHEKIFLPIYFGEDPIRPNFLENLPELDFVSWPQPTELAQSIDRTLQAIELNHVLEAETKEKELEGIETQSAVYLEEVMKNLDQREKTFQKKAKFWLTAGSVFYFISILFAITYTIYQIKYVDNTNLTLPVILFYSFRGLMVTALSVIFGKWASAISARYLEEALRIFDRIHAINFGKFYLKAFSHKMSWAEIKEIFQHWNIERYPLDEEKEPDDGFNLANAEKFINLLKGKEK